MTYNMTESENKLQELKKSSELMQKQIAELEIEIKKEKSVSILDRVKTFKDACCVLGISYEDELEFHQGRRMTKNLIAYHKLLIIAEALREGNEVSWYDTNQYKYYPWFKTQNNAFVFYYTNYYNYNSVVPSALCLETDEKAEYFGKQFIDIWRDYLTTK